MSFSGTDNIATINAIKCFHIPAYSGNGGAGGVCVFVKEFYACTWLCKLQFHTRCKWHRIARIFPYIARVNDWHNMQNKSI